MEEEMIQAQAMAARLACARMTSWHLEALQGSVERACCLVARSEWDRKAAAHAEMFGLLAEVADDPVLAPALRDGAGCVRELMMAVGRAADWIIVNSRRQLLEYLRAGDGEAAAQEMEKHLRVLLFMFRLARSGSKAETGYQQDRQTVLAKGCRAAPVAGGVPHLGRPPIAPRQRRSAAAKRDYRVSATCFS